jgi:hypothetical protein
MDAKDVKSPAASTAAAPASITFASSSAPAGASAAAAAATLPKLPASSPPLGRVFSSSEVTSRLLPHELWCTVLQWLDVGVRLTVVTRVCRKWLSLYASLSCHRLPFQ